MTATTKNNETVILVTGATGTVGTEVVRQLTSSSNSSLSSGSRVRAAVHSKDKADKLRDENKTIEIVDMDYNNPESIINALNGIDKLFLLTLPRLNMPEITSRVINEAKKNEVKHIVKLSVLCRSWAWLNNRTYAPTRRKLVEESGIPYTFLHADAFMQNFVNFFGQTIRTQSAFYIPAGDGKVSFVDARDIAAVATLILLAKNNGTKINDRYENKKYGITGNKALSYSQVAEILSNALGRRITYVNITEEDARKAMKKMGIEEWLIDALIEFYNVIKSGDASQSTAVVEQITGRKPISFEQFVRDYSSSFN